MEALSPGINDIIAAQELLYTEYLQKNSGQVVGVGIDLCSMPRFVKDLAQPYFTEEFCSEEEIRACDRLSGKKRDLFYATHWAAKEAVVKALGGGGEEELDWHEIILRRSRKKPYIHLTGEAKKRAEEIGANHFFISITHTKDLVIAFCIAQNTSA